MSQPSNSNVRQSRKQEGDSVMLVTVLIAIVGIISFLVGAGLIRDLEEISIGKRASQLIALIFGILAFYRIDSIPFIEELIPDVSIESEIVEWVIYFIFAFGTLVCHK